MRVPRLRTFVAAVAVILLAALLAVLFAPNPVAVDVARVQRGPMVVTVSSEGKTRVKNEYEVVAPLAGRLLRVDLKAGDKVEAGKTVVARIEPPQPQLRDARTTAEIEAKVRAAEALHALALAEVDRAKAELDFAKRELERNSNLSGIGAVSARMLQQTEREAKTREAALAVAQNALKQRAFELESTKASLLSPNVAADDPAKQHTIEVVAPVGGRVLNVLRESETVVAPGMPIVQLGDVANLEVMLEMLSEDAVKVREGAPATLEGWGGERLNGRVRLIEPFGFTKVSALGIEEQRVRVLIDFTDPPEKWRRLGHGFRVNAKIVVWKDDNVLKAPIGALFRSGNKWATFVLAENTARLQTVDIGHLSDTEAEVLGGLAEGANVILHPSDNVANGVPVRPRAKRDAD